MSLHPFLAVVRCGVLESHATLLSIAAAEYSSTSTHRYTSLRSHVCKHTHIYTYTQAELCVSPRLLCYANLHSHVSTALTKKCASPAASACRHTCCNHYTHTHAFDPCTHSHTYAHVHIRTYEDAIHVHTQVSTHKCLTCTTTFKSPLARSL